MSRSEGIRGHLLLGALSCLSLACGPSEPADRLRPNILLILADDVGSNDLGSYGNTSVETPNIDRLAASGSRFTRFYTAGDVCSPTRASLLTGQYPQRFGYQATPRGLYDEVVTLPELLRNAGYATHHVGKWHLGESPPSVTPPAQGFDSFYGFLHAWRTTRKGSFPTYRDPFLVTDRGKRKRTPGHLTDLLTDRAVERILAGSEAQPWFLNVWYFAPHEPIEPPERWSARFPEGPRSAYYALLGAMDEGVGRILDALERSGQTNDTIVLFLSDNGGVEAESNLPRFGVKTQFFEGGLRVPMIVRMPDHDGPAVVDALVSSNDVLPTIVSLASIALDPGHVVDGVDFSPVLLGDSQTLPERALFWESRSFANSHAREIRPRPESPAGSDLPTALDFSVLDPSGRWRFSKELRGIALFDLVADPTGGVNILDRHPERAAALIARYREWSREVRRIPVRVVPSGDAVWDGDVATFAGSGRIDLLGYDVIRAPGQGGWSFAIGIEPARAPGRVEVIAEQRGIWSLVRNPAGQLIFGMGDAKLVVEGPGAGVCADVVATAAFRLARSAKRPKGKLNLFVNGRLAASTTVDFSADQGLERATSLGAGASGSGFTGRLLHPTLMNLQLAADAVADWSEGVCGGEANGGAA